MNNNLFKNAFVFVLCFYFLICNRTQIKAATLNYQEDKTCINKYNTINQSLVDSGIDQNINWSLDDNGTLTITGTGDIPNYSYSYAPWYQYRDSIKTIIIGDSIISIGDQAFISCTNLVSIDFGNSITSIGEGAFYECSSIETIFIPNIVTSISDGAFCECTNLTHIVLPNTITSIGDEALLDCPNITAYVYDNSYSKTYCVNNSINYAEIETDFVLYGISAIPSKTDYLRYEEFDFDGLVVNEVYKSNEVSILIRIYEGFSVSNFNLNTIGYQDVTVSYKEFTTQVEVNVSQGSVLYSGIDGNINWSLYQDGSLLFEGTGDMPIYTPWYQYEESIKCVEILDGVTSISNDAFYGCSNLTSITISDSVTSIGSHAFYNCSSLTSITIPDSVTSIGNYAFRDCSSLTSVTIGNSVTSIGNLTFYNCSNLTSLTMPISTTFKSNSFYGVSNLTSITLTKGTGTGVDYTDVTYQYTPWYESRSSLESLIIEDGITSIGNYSFCNLTSLTSIIIPDSVTSIGERAFSGCSSVLSVNIPNGVNSIGTYAFKNCSSIKSIVMPISTKRGIFEDVSNLTSITLTRGTGIGVNYYSSSYKSSPWYKSRNSLESVILEDGIISIGDYSFHNCTGLTSIIIPDSVTSIGERAFSGCSNLTSLTMPISTVINPYKKSFDEVTRLTSVILTKGTSVGADYTYETLQHTPWYKSNQWLTSLTLEEGITTIGDYSFCNCFLLTSITIPNSVTSIGEHAFSGCSGLTSITIPNSVTSIGSTVFSDCSSLTSITIPDSITSIGDGAFINCSSLASITIPDSVTSIINYAFSNCSSLASITIPNSVTSIGNYAFYGCSGLTSITIPDSVTSIGTDAFSGCSSDLLLCGYENTYLQEYCLDNGLTYQELSKISNKTMSGTLKNNGTVSLTLNVEVDDGVDLDNAYALINGKKVSLDSIDSNGRVSIVTPGVAPKSINDDFVIRYYDKDDNPISKEINLSVKDYIETLLNGYLNKKTKTFYKSLLNYASYAQEYFDYNTDNLANESLDELDKDVSDVTHDDLTAYSASKAGLTEGISAYGQTLVLNNEVDYRIYFLLDGSHSIDEYIFKDGNNTLNKFKYSNSLYYVIIPKMAAPDLDKSHTVTVTLNGEGNLSITSSVLTYVEITLKDEPISQKDIQLANLMKALYKYSISAKNLLGA